MNEKFNKLPEEMRQAITALKELHATPDSMALQVVLGTANLAAMRLWNVDSRIYGIRPINEFFVCMAPTGAMKSTNYRECLVAVEQYQRFRQDELANEVARYAIDKKVYAKKEAEYIKLKDTDPALAVAPDAVRPVETAKYTIGKATVNGIVDQLKSQPYVGLFSSEAGEFFNSHSFQGRDVTKAIEMSASLTSMWDGHDIEKLTGMEKVSLRNRRVNMLFLLQAETIQTVLNTPVFSEQGFIHRMLITQCDYYEKPDWEFTTEAYQRQHDARQRLEGFHDRIRTMMHQPVAYITGKNFELDLPTMRQTDQAFEYLGRWRNQNKERAAGDLKNYAGFAERLHEHALRLAATIAAFLGQDMIKQADAEAACALMEYYIEQRVGLEIGVSDYNPTRSAGASKLADWFRQFGTATQRGWTGSVRELQQQGPAWYRKLNKVQRDEILADLLSDEVIEIEHVVAANGRKVPVIRLV